MLVDNPFFMTSNKYNIKIILAAVLRINPLTPLLMIRYKEVFVLNGCCGVREGTLENECQFFVCINSASVPWLNLKDSSSLIKVSKYSPGSRMK